MHLADSLCNLESCHFYLRVLFSRKGDTLLNFLELSSAGHTPPPPPPSSCHVCKVALPVTFFMAHHHLMYPSDRACLSIKPPKRLGENSDIQRLKFNKGVHFVSVNSHMHMSSIESQKGISTIQQCSVKNQKGAITVQNPF